MLLGGGGHGFDLLQILLLLNLPRPIAELCQLVATKLELTFVLRGPMLEVELLL